MAGPVAKPQIPEESTMTIRVIDRKMEADGTIVEIRKVETLAYNDEKKLALKVSYAVVKIKDHVIIPDKDNPYPTLASARKVTGLFRQAPAKETPSKKSYKQFTGTSRK